MALTIAELVAKVGADTGEFHRKMRDVDSTTEKTTTSGSSRFKSFGGAAALAAGSAGIGALVFALDKSIERFMSSQQVTRQTEAVLRSTGGAAHVSAAHVDELAKSIFNKTGVDNEAVQSGENLLLTFTGVRNEVGAGNKIFDQATHTIVDMSVALGENMKSAAIQVGKALQDPEKGLTALRRVGVQFTDAQKEQIKTLVESGHTMEAQKLILGELRREFGGSAEAAGKTFSGQIEIAKVKLLNFGAEIVQKVFPIVKDWIQSIRDAVGPMFNVFKTIIGGINTVLGPIGGLKGAFKIMFTVMTGGLPLLVKYWDNIKHGFADVGRFIFDAAKAVGRWPLTVGKYLLDRAGDLIHAVTHLFSKLPGAIKHILGIKSPSRVMIGIGENIAQGLIIGMQRGARTAGGGSGVLSGGAMAMVPASATMNLNARFAQSYAFGGIALKPHIGIVGDAGPEAMIPLSDPRARQMLAPEGDVVIQLDGEVFGRVAREYLLRTKRRNLTAELS